MDYIESQEPGKPPICSRCGAPSDFTFLSVAHQLYGGVISGRGILKEHVPNSKLVRTQVEEEDKSGGCCIIM